MNFILFQEKSETISNIFSQTGHEELITSLLSIEGVLLAVAAPILFNSLIRSSEKYADSELPKTIIKDFNTISTIIISSIHLIVGLFIIAYNFSDSLIVANSYFYTFLIIILFYIKLATQAVKIILYPEIIINEKINKTIKTLKKKFNHSSPKEITFLIEKFINVLIFRIISFENKTFSEQLVIVTGQIETLAKTFDKNIFSLEKQLSYDKSFEESFDELCSTSYVAKESERKNSQLLQDNKQLLDKNINIFTRLWAAATRSDNVEAIAIIRRAICDISKRHIKNSKSNQWALSISNTIEEILYTSLSKKDFSSHGHILSSHWFYFVVLEKYKRISPSSIPRTTICKESFIKQIKMQLSLGDQAIKESICKDFLEGHHDQSDNRHSLRLITSQLENNLALSARKELRELVHIARSIKNEDTFTHTMQEYDRIIKKYKIEDLPNSTEKEIQDGTRYFEWEYMHSVLQLVHFYTGAYALFIKDYNLVEYIWSFKQPHDTNAHWCNSDTVPVNAQDTIDIYFNKIGYRNTSHTFKDHHNSELYFRKYFIYLLIKNRSTFDQIKITTPNIDTLNNIINESERILNSLRYTIDKHEINSLFSLTPYFDPMAEIQKLFITIIQKSETVRLKIKNQTEASSTKIKNFEDLVSTTFKKEFKIESFFKKHFSITRGVSENENMYGISQMVDKSAFFDQWHVSYSGMGTHFGKEISRHTTRRIVKQLFKNAKSISKIEFHDFLDQHKDRFPVIIASRYSAHHFFKDDTYFVPIYDINTENENSIGEYKHLSVPIPIYSFPNNNKSILILFMNQPLSLQINKPKASFITEDKIHNDSIYVNVQKLTEEERNTLISNNRSSFKEFKTNDEIILHLEQQLKVDVYIDISISTNTYESYQIPVT